jgi:hypothetical protein
VNRPDELTRARPRTTGVTGVGSRARRTDRPVSGSAPGIAERIVPLTVTVPPAETVRRGPRGSVTRGVAAGKKPGRRDEGNRARADWKLGDVMKSRNASAPRRFTDRNLRGLTA